MRFSDRAVTTIAVLALILSVVNTIILFAHAPRLIRALDALTRMIEEK